MGHRVSMVWQGGSRRLDPPVMPSWTLASQHPLLLLMCTTVITWEWTSKILPEKVLSKQQWPITGDISGLYAGIPQGGSICKLELWFLKCGWFFWLFHHFDNSYRIYPVVSYYSSTCNDVHNGIMSLNNNVAACIGRGTSKQWHHCGVLWNHP